MDEPLVTIDPRHRWGTPCLRDTGISVAHIVALHRAGHGVDRILEVCPDLDGADVAAALAWHRDHGDDALGPRPPDPGDRHPRVAVDRGIQGGAPTIRGTRITVDTILGMWEQGFSASQIIDEFPDLTVADIADAVAYDGEVA
mgnify:CR=1 FL=1